jgi:hypothetical protein
MQQERHPGEVQLLNLSLGLPVDQALRTHILEELHRNLDRVRPSPRGFLRPLVWAPAAVVLLMIGFLLLVHDSQPTPAPGIHLKGAMVVRVYVKRAEQTILAEGSFLFRPGDQIRLGIISPKPIFVSALTGHPASPTPIPNLTDVPVSEGQEVLLPGSFTLGCQEESETLLLHAASTRGAAAFDQRTIVLPCERP